MVECGVARPSKSPWASPLQMAIKKDQSWRPCGDYRGLNARTIPDSYPVPHIADFTHRLSGCTVFSVLDLVKAYQQIRVAENDICKTAITTPFGLFEFPYMTFGLRNAGQTFQRFINEVLQGFDFCFSYVDDILVYSKDAAQHHDHLRHIFKRFDNYGVVLNAAKCIFGAKEVTFLGYRISASGTLPPPERIQAIQEFSPPKTVQGLRRFLGMLNYYRRFLPQSAKLQAPLHEAIVKINGKGAKPVPWTPELHEAFEACKASLSSATLLVHPIFSAPLGLFTDASSLHVGACLQQQIGNDWKPLGFFSKKLTARQSQWPAYYRELLALYESVQHFRHILEAQHVTIYTDHKPLLYAFKQRREKLPPVQLNQLSFISQFTTDVAYIKGKDNVVADALSRIEAISLEEDPAPLATLQDKDDELQEIRSQSSLRMEKMPVSGSSLSLWCDTSTSRPRPYVPQSLRRTIFNRLHNLSHPGARATTRLVTERYVWPSVRKDCHTWVRYCIPCQKSKVTRHNVSSPGHFATPSLRLQHVHIDIIGPLPPCKGYSYCLTMIDRHSRWPEVWPMIGITAEEVADTFLQGWVSRFGVPAIITTDQGRQFESDLFNCLLQTCAIQRSRTTSYHPCANGMIERVHRQLKAAIMCHGVAWLSSLPLVLLGMRSAFKEDIKSTSAEMLYGETLRLPGEIISPATIALENPTDYVVQLRRKMSELRPAPASSHNKLKTFTFKNLKTASHAFLRDDTVRRPLQPPYNGPFSILERSQDAKTITLDIKGKKVVVSVDRVKPAFVEHESAETDANRNRILPTASHAPGPTSTNSPTHTPPLPSTPPAPRTTRSGRKVKFKEKDEYFYF